MVQELMQDEREKRVDVLDGGWDVEVVERECEAAQGVAIQVQLVVLELGRFPFLRLALPLQD